MSYFQRANQHKALNFVVEEFKSRINSSAKSNVDGIDWTLKLMKDFPAKPGKPLPLLQMSHELVHLLGASHTPVGMTLTQMVWQMLARPEYLEPLRKEAEAAVAKVGFTDRIVEHLPLQDSFIREANRLYPTNLGKSKVILRSTYLANKLLSGRTAHGCRRTIRLPGRPNTASWDENCFSRRPIPA